MKPITIEKALRLLSTFGVLSALYLTITCTIHYALAPEPALTASLAPKVGTIIENPRAGERIVVTQDRFETRGKSVQIEVTLQPGGAVPVAHVHGSIEEFFEVLEGRVTFTLDGASKTLEVGESVRVPAGTSHVPSNAHAQPARFRVTMTPPGDLDICLVQFHHFLSQGPEAPSPVDTLLQMARYASAYDIYLAGLPIRLQRLGIWLLTPTLRMLGYQPWNKEHAIAYQSQ